MASDLPGRLSGSPASADSRAALFRAELFRDLPTSITYKAYEAGRQRELADGDRLLRPGQRNDALFVVLSGRLEVRLDVLGFDEPVTVGPGDTLGELSIIDGEPASAEIVAVGPARVLAIPEEFFWTVLTPNRSFARNLARLLASRTRASNRRVIVRLEEHFALERLQRDLGIARTIQAGMLPGRGELFPGRPEVQVFGRMDPAQDIGGDLYDAFFVGPDRLAVAIGDVSGKGIPAALFMAKVVAQLRLVALSETSPASVLTRLNALLCESNEAGMFVTLLYAVLDVRTGRVTYSNAGHLPPVISGPQAPRFVPLPRGLVAGIESGVTYTEHGVTLEPGETLLLYTDGVTEAEDASGSLYGESRLLEDIASAAPADAGTLVSAMTSRVLAHASGAPPSDDITLMAIHRRGATV